MFSAFPGGWPGLALLVLRALVGVTAATHGAAYLTAGDATISAKAMGVVSLVNGASLILGFLTPAAGAIVGIGTLTVELLRISTPASAFQLDTTAAVFVVTDAIAIALLGPGAFSLDALLFGRREIVISQSSHSR